MISIVSKMTCEPFWKTGSFAVGFLLKKEGLKFLPVTGFTWKDV